MNINILLPYKEEFDNSQAGAVSILVKQQLKNSIYRQKIKIYGISRVKNKKFNNFIPLKQSKFFRNHNYVKEFSKVLKKNKSLTEIHNRPQYFNYLYKKYKNQKYFLYFHNDPTELEGSKSSVERKFIYDNCDKIIFLSNWIKDRFFKDLKIVRTDNFIVFYPGAAKAKKIPKKENIVVFIGKLNRAKGYDIFCEATKKFLRLNKNWKIVSAGTEIRRNIPVYPHVNELGQISHLEATKLLARAKLSVVNSRWDEPLGRSPIESAAQGCVCISSNTGGLLESNKDGIILKNNNAQELFVQLLKFSKNVKLYRKKQALIFTNFAFSLQKQNKLIDSFRFNFFKHKEKATKASKVLKVLHISNFNENSDGRLFYSTPRKINLGFIKLGHNLISLDERDFLRKGLGFFNQNSLSNKILNTVKNFSPDLILIGHTNKISSNVIREIKKTNPSVKIARLYIDSISKEFFKQNSKILLNNISFIDKIFLTSKPNSFLKKYSKKVHYVPNPVDSSVEILKNFNNKTFEYDLFFALSHGQNRTNFKPGKKDERDDIIDILNNKISAIKKYFITSNNHSPKWGSEFYHYLSKSKMALNISRGSYQSLYSSDRIASLMGNGLLVFVNQKNNFDKLFSKKEVVFYKSNIDLIKKIIYYSKHYNETGKSIARNGHRKYHKEFSSIKVCDFIIKKMGLKNKYKNFYWENIC